MTTAEKPKWLIIPVEVLHRELPSKILLSAMAAKHGFRVLIGNDRMIRRLVSVLPKGIIFDKSLGLARHGKPQAFKKYGHKVVVLDEESTGFYGSPDRILYTRIAAETMAASERWYCLSDILRDAARDAYPDHQSKFVTTGLLRTDIWQKQFHHLYADEVEQIKAKQGKFILFNSNFGIVIHANGRAFVEKQIEGQKSAYAGIGRDMNKIFEQGQQNFEAYLELLPKLLDWFPEHKVIIRPHPSEDISFWEENLGAYERVEIVTNSTATAWILASDILLHHGCTTGIEAEILGKPHVMYAPKPDNHHETEMAAAFAEITRTEEDLIGAIKARLDPSYVSTKPIEEKEKWFASLEETLVVEKLLEDLETLAFPSQELSTSLPLAIKVRIWFANNKPRSEKERNYSTQKWPGSSTAEISEKLRQVSVGLNLSETFNVTERFDQVWEISR